MVRGNKKCIKGHKMIDFISENFNWKGLIIIILSLLPSVIMSVLPPKNAPIPPVKGNTILTILETLGRIAFLAILLFSKKSFEKKVDIWFILMCVFGLLYYIGWLRYFCFGRTYELLYKPLWFIPIPLALFPVLAFIFTAIWGRSILLGTFVAVLAIGHLPQSYLYYKKLKAQR